MASHTAPAPSAWADHAVKSGSDAKARQLTTSNGKLKGCDEDVDDLKTKQTDMEKSFGEKQKAWDEEKKTIGENLKTCEGNAEKMKSSQQVCQQELASCKSGDIYAAPPPGAPKEDPYD